MLHPGEVGVALGRDAVLPADIVVVADPVGVVERRIGQDVIGLEVGVQVAAEGVGVFRAEVAPRCREWPGSSSASRQVVGLRLLAVDGDVADPPAVGLDEFLALHEHAARAAAGVVDAALVRGEHLDQHADDAAGRVELAALLALGAGELGEEIFVDAAQDVLGAVLLAAQADGADQVDQFAEALLVERRAGRSPWAERP